jgi:mRNA interferase MazF
MARPIRPQRRGRNPQSATGRRGLGGRRGPAALQIVVPLTDWKPHYVKASWFVSVPASPANGLSKDSGADAFQVKSLSENRFVKRLGEATSQQLDDIAAAVALCVGAS